jgi:hypothetical protein
VAITELEKEKWTPEVGLDINDPIADNYRIVQTNDALSLVMCSSPSYSGWLAKQVSPLVVAARKIRFQYTLMIDDATVECGQVAETDSKITDSEGYTYDLSAQWEMVKAAPGWMFQIDNADWTWTDTGIVIPAAAPYEQLEIEIESALDYEQKVSAVKAVCVNSKRYEVPEGLWWIPAKQCGWAPSEIVSQMQQCNRGEPGGYTLRFWRIGYALEDW